MSNPLRPSAPAVFDQEWFQIFWKCILIVIAVVFALLTAKLVTIYLRLRYGQRASPRVNPPAPVPNDQWGDVPGVVVAGADGETVYRPADKLGDFGSKIPQQVPELQDAMLALGKSKRIQGDGSIVVAERASSSDTQACNIPIAKPHIMLSKLVPENIV